METDPTLESVCKDAGIQLAKLSSSSLPADLATNLLGLFSDRSDIRLSQLICALIH